MTRVTMSRRDGQYLGAVEFDTYDGPITVGASGESQADALANAAGLAESIASNPVLQALLPPGTLLAIRSARTLGKAARAGGSALKGALSRLRGPGKRRLGRQLAKEERARRGRRIAQGASTREGAERGERGERDDDGGGASLEGVSETVLDEVYEDGYASGYADGCAYADVMAGAVGAVDPSATAEGVAE